MKISVVMTTYNGSKFVIEQLESIRRQTHQVNEVIIADDQSTDDCVKMVEAFINEHKLINWSIYVNEKNMGWKKNFFYALEKATGDYIFLCDQDDVWNPQKVEIMISEMEENKQISLLTSDMSFVEKYEINKRKRSCIYLEKNKILHVTKPGAVYCFRRELFEKVKKYWDFSMPHDAQLWFAAMIENGIYNISMPLIYYRRHEGTATGHDVGTLQKKMKNLEFEQSALTYIKNYCNAEKIGKEFSKRIRRAEKYLAVREKMLKQKSIVQGIRNLPQLSFYIKVSTYLGDLRAIIKK